MKNLLFALFTLLAIFVEFSASAMGEDKEDKEEAQQPITRPSRQTWDFLKPGDQIEVLAPAAAPTQEELKKAEKIISEYGYTCLLPKTNQEESLSKYYANPFKTAGEEFKNSLTTGGNALWAIRGGFGSLETICAFLKKSNFLPSFSPKLIIGFSDITSFHLLVATRGWPSLHAPVLAYGVEISSKLTNKYASFKPVFDCLSGKTTELEYTFECLHDSSWSFLDPLEGSVLGGNISIIETHKGTDIALDGTDKFVFLEDRPEDKTRLHRRLTGLAYAKIFDKAKAILVGNMPIKEQNETETKNFLRGFSKELEEVFDVKIPLLYCPRFGHGDYNDVMPFGTSALLKVGKETATLFVKVNEPVSK